MAWLGERALHPFLFERHSEVNQSSGVVALLQFHIGKKDAVAAQAAIRTKLFDAIHFKEEF
jgi:hypothetical protein